MFVRLGFEEAEQSFAERLSRRASAARRRSS